MSATSREIWHLDNVTQECGYFASDTTVNNGYGCLHPEQEDQEEEEEEDRQDGARDGEPRKCGRCFSFTCPLGSELNPGQDPDDRKEFRKHGMNPASFSDGEWMLVSVNDGRLVGAKES